MLIPSSDCRNIDQMATFSLHCSKFPADRGIFENAQMTEERLFFCVRARPSSIQHGDAHLQCVAGRSAEEGGGLTERHSSYLFSLRLTSN